MVKMMNKKVKVWAFLFAFMFWGISPSMAQFYPPCLGCPIFDPFADVPETLRAILTGVRDGFTEAQTEIGGVLNDLKSMKNYIPFNLAESPLKKEDDSPINSAAKDIATSKKIDIASPEQVSELCQYMFLKYPTDLQHEYGGEHNEFIKREYEKKAVEFANDMMLELYVAARALESERMEDLDKEIKGLSDCYVLGLEGTAAACEDASTTDDEVGNMTNKSKLEMLRDKQLRMYQEFMAMKTMALTSEALQKGIEPVNADKGINEDQTDDSDKVSFYQGHDENFEAMGFAQLVEKQDTYKSSAKKASKKAEEESSAPINKNLELIESEGYQRPSRFEGAEDQINALPLLDAIHELLKEAVLMHNTKNQLPTLREPFVEYEKANARYRVVLSRLYDADINTRDYLGDYYGISRANTMWFGPGCYLKTVGSVQLCDKLYGCKGPKDYALYPSNKIVCGNRFFAINEYGKRDGLSGEAISAYKLLKAEKVSEDISGDGELAPTQEKAASSINTPAINSDASIGVPDADADSETSNSGLFSGDSDVSDPTVNEDVGNDMRELLLDRWSVGSYISKDIGEDMTGDNKKYGEPEQKYPIWDDEKRFYDEYLREKYNNMRLYFDELEAQKMIFKFASALNESMDITDVAKSTCYIVSPLLTDKEKQAKINECLSKLKQELEQTKENNRGFIKEASDAFDEKLENLASKRLAIQEQYYSNMDTLISNFEGSLVSFEEQKADIHKLIDDLNISLNEARENYNTLQRDKKRASSNAKSQDDTIEIQNKRKKEDPTYVTGIEDKAAATKEEKESVSAQKEQEAEAALEGVDEGEYKLKALRNRFDQINEEIKELKQEYMEQAVELEDWYFESINKSFEEDDSELIFITGSASMIAISGMSQVMFNEFKVIAQAAVVLAYANITLLGENKYDPEKYPSILKIHKEVMDKIKAIVLMPASVNVGNFVIKGSEVTGEAVFDASTSEEDDVYFVGIDPKLRDFTAPKRIAVEYAPPVRELFYFDNMDYNTIVTTEKTLFKRPKTTRYEFLKAVQDPPAIWKRILGRKGFVEKDVNMTTFFKSASDIQRSNFLTAKGEKVVNLSGGELSVILDYAKGLVLTNPISNLAAKFDKDLSEEKEKEYRYRFLTRDQVGNFLQFVDMEQEYQKNIDQLKVKVDEAKKTVEDVISKTGCTYLHKETGIVRPMAGNAVFSVEFIADEEVYQSVANCLDEGKNMFINEALKVAEKLPSLNPFLAQMKQKTDNLTMALQKDSDELVELSENTDLAQLEDQIKSKKTDAKAVGKYQTKAQKEFDKSLEAIERPYRARYIKSQGK